MRVKDLIAALQSMDGDLEVYGYCDHGQTAEMVSAPSEIFVERTDHTLFDGYASEGEDAEEYGYTVKAVLL